MSNTKFFAAAACVVFISLIVSLAILTNGGSLWPKKAEPRQVENAPLFDSVTPGEYVGLIATSPEIAIIIVDKKTIHIYVRNPETGCVTALALTYDGAQQEMRLAMLFNKIDNSIIYWK